MEFPSTGSSCSDPACHRLDFLPLDCGCGLKFCSEHLRLHIVSCRSRTLNPDELRRIEDVYVCSRPGCRERSVVPLLCDKCGRHSCVTHRHVECDSKTTEEIEIERERYAEPVRRFNEAKAVVDEKVANSLAEAKKNPKTRSTAAKIQLMKLKGRATGPKTIPTTDRLYFHVTDPSSGRTVALFVSRKWTVGRCIDAVAQELRFVNNNNRSDGRKVRLFRDGAVLAGEVSAVLDGLVEGGAVCDGDGLTIGYVEDC